MSVAALHGGRFGIVTTLQVSVPVIEENVKTYGHEPDCAGVLASGLPVLEVEAGGSVVESRLAATIRKSRSIGARSVILGCAGMSRLAPAMAERTGAVLIDGVRSSAHLAHALAERYST